MPLTSKIGAITVNSGNTVAAIRRFGDVDGYRQQEFADDYESHANDSTHK
jgi:hypothetical protein